MVVITFNIFQFCVVRLQAACTGELADLILRAPDRVRLIHGVVLKESFIIVSDKASGVAVTAAVLIVRGACSEYIVTDRCTFNARVSDTGAVGFDQRNFDHVTDLIRIEVSIRVTLYCNGRISNVHCDLLLPIYDLSK